MPQVSEEQKFVYIQCVDETSGEILRQCVGGTLCLRAEDEIWKRDQHDLFLPPLSASSLAPEEIYRIFKLKPDFKKTFEFLDHEVFEVPRELAISFEDLNTSLQESLFSEQSLTSTFIDHVITRCMFDERVAMRENLLSSIQREPRSEPVEMSLFLGTELKQAITLNGNRYRLSSFADFSLGYPDEKPSSKLVVVRAERGYQGGEVYGQLLAYMSMLHTIRKAEEVQDSTIFGLATDGLSYRFWMIDNDSNVTKSSIYDWSTQDESVLIYSILRAMVRAAARARPLTTSPIEVIELSSVSRTFHGLMDSCMFGHYSNDLFEDEYSPLSINWDIPLRDIIYLTRDDTCQDEDVSLAESWDIPWRDDIGQNPMIGIWDMSEWDDTREDEDFVLFNILHTPE